MKIFFLIFVIFININFLFCQNSLPIKPFSWQKKLIGFIPTINLPTQNNDSLENHSPEEKFGTAISVNIGLNHGRWDTIENKIIWRLGIKSTNAYSLNFIFDLFHLPDSGLFFIYNKERDQLLGAFCAELNNHDSLVFATDLIYDKEVVLEYNIPLSQNAPFLFHLDKVIHGFRKTNKKWKDISNPCHINVECPQGNNWCMEKGMVCRILYDNNTSFGTGTLVSTTSLTEKDCNPAYVLTAFHLFRTKMNGCYIINPPNSSTLFFFKYYQKKCNRDKKDTEPTSYVLQGADMYYGHPSTDIILLKLHSKPQSGTGVFYSGWDANVTFSQIPDVLLHHPKGSPMKITQIKPNIIPYTFFYPQSNPLSLCENIYTFEWKIMQGGLESGSSGAALYNIYHKIIGVQSMRPENRSDYDNSCDKNISKFAGRLDLAYNDGLCFFLDPLFQQLGLNKIAYHNAPPTYLINQNINQSFSNFAAINILHLQGGVNVLPLNFPFSPAFCPVPNNQNFVIQPNSKVIFKARGINICPFVEFELGSEVDIIPTMEVQCQDNVISGINTVFCKLNNLCEDYSCPSKTHINTFANFGNNLNEFEIKKDIINYQQLVVYPNPTSDFINLYFTDSELWDFTVFVYDLKGTIVKEQTFYSSYHEKLSLNNIPSGMYLVYIVRQGKTYMQKFIIER